MFSVFLAATAVQALPASPPSRNLTVATQDKDWLALLWEAGLSVSIQMRYCPDMVDFAKARNHAAEGLKAINAASLSETFLQFALLARQLKVEKEADGCAHGLRFNNSPYNASMHRAAMGVLLLLDGDGDRFLKAMSKLELACGREFLSNAYSKLSRLVMLCKQAATQEHPAHVMAAWLVEMLHLALKLKMISAKQATEVWLFGDRKNGTSGFWQACLVLKEASQLKCSID